MKMKGIPNLGNFVKKIHRGKRTLNSLGLNGKKNSTRSGLTTRYSQRGPRSLEPTVGAYSVGAYSESLQCGRL